MIPDFCSMPSRLHGALLLIDANGHGGAVASEELTTGGQDQEQVDGEQGLRSTCCLRISSDSPPRKRPVEIVLEHPPEDHLVLLKYEKGKPKRHPKRPSRLQFLCSPYII